MKKILIGAALVMVLAVPCLATEPLAEPVAQKPVPQEPVIPPPVTSASAPPASMTPKEQVQAAVEHGQTTSFTRRRPAPSMETGNASLGLGNVLSPDTVALSAKEMKALELSDDWAKSGPAPFLSGGKLTYIHGTGGIPTIIAAPMQITDVELEPGEQVNEIVTGDSARWLVEMGAAGNTTHIFIKPLDVGLESSVAVTTDRRVYHLRLVSKPKEHTPYVGFVYSDDLRKQLAAHKADDAKKKKWQSTADAGGVATNLASLNFDYEIKGDAPWKPERVFDDGKKTYVQLPPEISTGEMPALLVKKGGKDVLVNYRVKGRVMEVDGLFETIALVVGVNGGLFNTGIGGERQQIVEITRRGGTGRTRSAARTQPSEMELIGG